jgi:hypothetical protein
MRPAAKLFDITIIRQEATGKRQPPKKSGLSSLLSAPNPAH